MTIDDNVDDEFHNEQISSAAIPLANLQKQNSEPNHS
jgi:hypothetical protein